MSQAGERRLLRHFLKHILGLIFPFILQRKTQQQIADAVGIEQDAVSRILNGYEKNGTHFKGLIELMQNGKFAEFHKNFNPFLYNIWNIERCNVHTFVG